MMMHIYLMYMSFIGKDADACVAACPISGKPLHDAVQPGEAPCVAV